VPPPGAVDERTRALELVLRHGSSANAFQTLQAGYRYFWYGSNACVAYTDTGGAWVAAGAPIARREERAAVISAFFGAARAAGRRACFFASDEPLCGADGEALPSLGIGEQPVWDPRGWSASLRGHRSLREQLRRARAKGVSIRELGASDAGQHLRAQITRLCERWLASRRLAPMAFLVQLEPFGGGPEPRLFVAEQSGRVIGFARLIPVPARSGWFLENLVRDPGAPNGTSELLVHAVMAWASAAECGWLTLGLAPLAGTVPPLLARVRDSTRWLYDFAGLRAYKAKFRPDFWQTAYLCHPKTQSGLRTVIDTLAAFAQGGFLRFAWRTLLRGRTWQPLRAFALQLTPWSLLGPIWAAIATAGYASRASLAAAISNFSSAATSRSRPSPRTIGS
jgi:phosphatidylglycerol lysyltransferase